MTTENMPATITTAKEMDFLSYWRVIVKRKWTIITVFVIVVTYVSINTAKLRYQYKATARLTMSSERQNLVSFDKMFRIDTGSKDFLHTQYIVLRSRQVLDKVIDKLELENNPEFFPENEQSDGIDLTHFFDKLRDYAVDLGRDVITLIKSSQNDSQPVIEGKDRKSAEDEMAEKRAGRREQLYHRIAAKLQFKPVPESSVVMLHFTGYNAEIITEVLNTMTRVYVDRNLENRHLATEDAGLWLNEQLDDMRQKVEESERALQSYREEVGIIDFDQRNKILAQEISVLNGQITEIKRKRLTWETLYENSLDPNLWDSLPAIIENPLIQEFQINLAKLENLYSEMTKKYGPKYPKIIQLKAQIETAKESLSDEIEKIHESTYTEYQLAIESEKILEVALTKRHEESSYVHEKSIRYGFLLREAESNRVLYDLLLRRLKETDLSSGFDQNNIKIIDPAVVPTKPFEPNKKKKILMGILIGLCCGVALAFAIEHLDNSVKDPDEISAKFGIPFLGLVGHHTVRSRGNRDRSADIKLISYTEPSSTISESLRTIRTNVIFSADDESENITMITSALPSEGKTTIACNLAVVMASLGDKVLLIDADLRRPSVHKYFNIEKSPGLSSYLINQCEVDEVVYETAVANLSIMPAGVVPPNPSELLSRPLMKALLTQACKRFDRIIIDTAPVASVTDSLVISRMVNAAIIVVRYRSTPRGSVAKAINQLVNVKTPIMGAILNDVDFSKDSYYYQYYSKYYYYKEDKDSKKDRRQGSSTPSREAKS